MNPEVTKAINQFCVAKQKLAKIQNKYSEERKPVSDRERDLKEKLKRWMMDNNLTIAKINSHTFLLMKKSATVTPLNLEGIERAIMNITPDDLKAAHETLKKKKKRGTKRKSDGEKVQGSSEHITMVDIWDCAAIEKIREAHLRENMRLVLKTNNKEEEEGDEDDADDVNDEASKLKIENQALKLAPEIIRNYTNEWIELKKKVALLREKNSEQCSEYKKTIEKEQPVVCEYLEENHPVDKTRVVVLTTKEGPLQFNLKKKESVRSIKQVRITTFKPIIKNCISQIHKTFTSVGKMTNYTNACTDEIKHSIFAVISTQYVKFQENQKVKKEYAALDKVAVKKEK